MTSDETIEGVAVALLAADRPDACGWSGKPAEVKDRYRRMARVAVEVTGTGNLLEAEEALHSTIEEYGYFREQVLMPLAEREGVSTMAIEAMPWDDLLGVAVRNLNAALEADAEVQRLKRLLKQRGGDAAEAEDSLAIVEQAAMDARAEADRLREVLRFYAARVNHAGTGISAVYNDRGQRARKALGECPTCEGLGLVKTGQRIMDQDGPYDQYATCRDCWGDGIPRHIPASTHKED